LTSWIGRLCSEFTANEDAFVYFNNDHRACALRDAIVFADIARTAGLDPTRVSARDEVTLAT
jgi:hypothetical protein